MNNWCTCECGTTVNKRIHMKVEPLLTDAHVTWWNHFERMHPHEGGTAMNNCAHVTAMNNWCTSEGGTTLNDCIHVKVEPLGKIFQ